MLNKIIYCLNFNFTVFKNNKNAASILFLLLLCFISINGVLSDDNDGLLVISRKHGENCRPVSSKQQKCNDGYELIWEIQYKTSYKDSTLNEAYDDLECRSKCFQDSKCILATYSYSKNCYMNDVYEPNKQYGHSNYELAVLSCCRKDIYMVNRTPTTSIDQSVVGKMTRPIKDKKNCLTRIYIKYSGQDSHFGDIKQYEKVTVEDCMKFCDSYVSCILFNYKNDKCTLKHVLNEISKSDDHDLYILHCIPRPMRSCEKECIPMTDRKGTCLTDALTPIVWYFNNWDYKFGGEIIKTSQPENSLICALDCLRSASCQGISYNIETKICLLHSSIGELQMAKDFETASLHCYLEFEEN